MEPDVSNELKRGSLIKAYANQKMMESTGKRSCIATHTNQQVMRSVGERSFIEAYAEKPMPTRN